MKLNPALLDNPSMIFTGWKGYVLALAVLVACNSFAWACSGFLALTNLLMIYLIGILLVVSRCGKGPSTFVCVLGVLSFDFLMVPPRFTFAPTDTQYLITLGVALAFTLALSESIDRARHESEEKQKARLKVETERMRSALLSSVSHDLRTPLAVITGSASSLLDPENHLSDAGRQELIQGIYGESERLNRLLSNLLEMTKLSAGKVQLKKEIQPLEEVIGAALSRLEKRLGNHPVKTDIPEDLPMLPLDSLLMEQVFINLVENAIKYTPPHSPIFISALSLPDALRVEVSDQGEGLKKGQEEKIFEKFYRGAESTGQGGVGLGLAICRAVVEAHGGNIWAENRAQGGACFCFTLPLETNPVLPTPLKRNLNG